MCGFCTGHMELQKYSYDILVQRYITSGTKAMPNLFIGYIAGNVWDQNKKIKAYQKLNLIYDYI